MIHLFDVLELLPIFSMFQLLTDKFEHINLLLMSSMVDARLLSKFLFFFFKHTLLMC